MLEYPDAGDDALGVHTDQGYHRLARVSGDVHDVGRQEYVTDQFAVVLLAVIIILVMFVVFVSIGLDIGRLAHAEGEAVGSRQYSLAWDVGAKIRIGR